MKSILRTMICLFISFQGFAQHTMLYPVSLDKQINNSALVIEGKVIAQESKWNRSHNYIYTLNTIKVFKSFKGESANTITLLTLGGRVGPNALKVSESLQLHVGESGVFTLKNSPVSFDNSQGSYEVVSDEQGFYRYTISSNNVQNPFKVYNGITNIFHELVKLKTKLPVKEIDAFDYTCTKTNNSTYKVAATFSPLSISAGTNSVVTISGAGFGNTQGTIEFKWADDGGVTYQPALTTQILSWSDAEIKVEVPTYAGTGTIRITDALNNTQVTSSELTITFAQSNGETFGDAVLSNLINLNSQGGYTWHMFTDFDNNQAAKTEFLDAFYTWKCSSNVNWVLGPVTTTDSSVVDGENVIRFDNGNELPMGVLGRCASYTFLCGTPQVEAVIEMDMTIDDSTSYHYGAGTPQAGEYDFQSVVVHELGHGHQLNHVIDSNDIMYYGLADAVVRRTLGTNDIAGSSYIQNRCSATGTCQFGATTSIACNIGLTEDKVLNNLEIYPNPAHSNFTVLASKESTISIFNSLGQEVHTQGQFSNDYWSFNCENWKSGLYIIITTENGNSVKTNRLLID